MKNNKKKSAISTQVSTFSSSGLPKETRKIDTKPKVGKLREDQLSPFSSSPLSTYIPQQLNDVGNLKQEQFAPFVTPPQSNATNSNQFLVWWNNLSPYQKVVVALMFFTTLAAGISIGAGVASSNDKADGLDATGLDTLRPTLSPDLTTFTPTFTSRKPTRKPTNKESTIPTAVFSVRPTRAPSLMPSKKPTSVITPTVEPTSRPMAIPSKKPTSVIAPTVEPTSRPMAIPSKKPTSVITPTVKPTVEPTSKSTFNPTAANFNKDLEISSQEQQHIIDNINRLRRTTDVAAANMIEIEWDDKLYKKLVQFVKADPDAHTCFVPKMMFAIADFIKWSPLCEKLIKQVDFSEFDNDIAVFHDTCSKKRAEPVAFILNNLRSNQKVYFDYDNCDPNGGEEFLTCMNFDVKSSVQKAWAWQYYPKMIWTEIATLACIKTGWPGVDEPNRPFSDGNEFFCYGIRGVTKGENIYRGDIPYIEGERASLCPKSYPYNNDGLCSSKKPTKL